MTNEIALIPVAPASYHQSELYSSRVIHSYSPETFVQ